MDRHKCPFHGRIVARDEMGNIVNECDKNDPSFKNQINTDMPTVMPWQDAELIADINANTGQNIEAVASGKSKRGGRKRKIASTLTDLSKEGDSPKKRLEKRFFTSKSLNRVGSILDSIERRHNEAKFHHNFNYSIQS